MARKKSAKTPAKTGQRRAPAAAESRSGAELYDGILARSSAHILEASRKGRDVAPAPPIQDRARRDAAAASLRTFLEVYFPQAFHFPWCPDHLRVIDRLQTVIADGAQLCIAMPRGSGKTTITERGVLWALLTGRRKFAVIVAANLDLAERSLSRLKSELEFNPLLLADWPKMVHPIRRLESQSRRCNGQLYEGQRTCLVWQKRQLILPNIQGPDAEGAGGILYVAGLGAAVRGLSHVGPDGQVVRPDLLIADDCQDRESARSALQTSERLSLLNGDLLGLAGPGRKIAALATCTVIYRNDLSDQLLDPEKSPAWQSERCKLIYQWPEREDLWQTYLELRLDGQKPHGDRAEATRFYLANRAEMDEGAVVAWPERFEPGDVSAIQHAYNLRQDRKEDMFMSEYQNDPIDPAAGTDALDPARIAARVGGYPRCVAPPEVERLTAFIDVGSSLLWFMVCGWDDAFTCNVLDYGPFPGQPVGVFHSRSASPTLDQVYPTAGGDEALIYAALSDLVDRLVSREWRRSDSATLRLGRILVDSGFAGDTVRLFIRQSPHRDILTPSKGMGLGPGRTPISEFKKRPGERLGDGFILGAVSPDRLRLCRFDSNFHKSRLAGMLTRPPGLRGGVTLFGDSPSAHELLASHLSSEYPTRTEANGNAVNVWNRRPEMENHLLDCLVGCCVGASMEGLSPLAGVGGGTPPAAPKARVSFKDMQEAKRKR